MNESGMGWMQNKGCVGMIGDRGVLLLFALACVCAVCCVAGCLSPEAPQDAMPAQPAPPDTVATFRLAETAAAECLTGCIKEEIAGNPELAGYTVEHFYNGTRLILVESSTHLPGDGTPSVTVCSFRHTMPSLKDPVNHTDTVIVQVTVTDGVVTDRVVTMGSNVVVSGP